MGWSSGDPGYVDKSMQVEETNPFLVPRLKFGEKEFSSVTVPSKLLKGPTMKSPIAENEVIDNPVSVLETFAGQVFRGGTEKDPSEMQRSLQFKIEMGKNSFGDMLDFRQEKKDSEKILSWFVENGEKDEKKRRAEKILKDYMDNPTGDGSVVDWQWKLVPGKPKGIMLSACCIKEW